MDRLVHTLARLNFYFCLQQAKHIQLKAILLCGVRTCKLLHSNNEAYTWPQFPTLIFPIPIRNSPYEVLHRSLYLTDYYTTHKFLGNGVWFRSPPTVLSAIFPASPGCFPGLFFANPLLFGCGSNSVCCCDSSWGSVCNCESSICSSWSFPDCSLVSNRSDDGGKELLRFVLL